MPRKRSQPVVRSRAGKSARWERIYDPNDPLRPQQPLVSARWLLGAGAIAVVVAAICAYAAMGLLFYLGQWQFFFHPPHDSRVIARVPNIPIEDIHFDYTETGKALLDGWWIPADPGGRYSAYTALLLHRGDQALPDTAGQLQQLHSLGINVFAFDYRGYGESALQHPSEARASADTRAAWNYLAETRHLPGSAIVILGQGLGASLGADLAAAVHPAALVMEEPGPSARQVFAQDARARMLPMWLLATQRLDPTEELHTLATPKLILGRNGSSPRAEALYRDAAFPKLYFDLTGTGEPALRQVLTRFFDEVLRKPRG